MARVTFDPAPPPGCLNLGIGQPSGDLTPPALLAELGARFFGRAAPADLNYGPPRGDPRFVEAVARFAGRAYGVEVDPATVFLTAGNSQALDLVCERFTRPGDAVLVEEPSYFLAFRILLDRGLRIVPVPVDGDGLVLDALEAAIARWRPALVYTIPSFNNPTGRTLSRARRERLADLSREHGFVVAADEVYQLLAYDGAPPPAMATLVDRGRVISMGSFSKILAPALRVGWLQAAAPELERVLASGWVNSGGAVNHLGSHLVREALESGLLEAHLDRLRAALRARRDAMHAALGEHLADLARWEVPGGGYFFWLTLASGLATAPLKPGALAAGTGFMPGDAFSAEGAFTDALRLCFAHHGEAELRESVARLGAVLRAAGG